MHNIVTSESGGNKKQPRLKVPQNEQITQNLFALETVLFFGKKGWYDNSTIRGT